MILLYKDPLSSFPFTFQVVPPISPLLKIWLVNKKINKSINKDTVSQMLWTVHILTLTTQGTRSLKGTSMKHPQH